MKQAEPKSLSELLKAWEQNFYGSIAEEMADRLKAIDALHREHKHGFCSVCETNEWPCPTRRILDGGKP